MIDLDKKLTKKEFRELLRSKYGFLITDWYCKPNGGLTDYYVSNIHKCTKKEKELIDQDKLEVFNLLKVEELRKITEIARKNISNDKEYKEIKINALKGFVNFKETSKDINGLLRYSYLAGICALGSYLLRYCSDERNNTIEDIFNADWSLFK